MEFHDFQIRAWTVDREHAEVLVHSSPAGSMLHPETVILHWEMLNSFETIFQGLNIDRSTKLATYGRELATIVFPDHALGLLIRSLERIDPEDGLRVRLCLDGTLSDLPWEYIIPPDIASLKSPNGFLALDARISLVREPPQPVRQRPRLQKKQRLLFFGTRKCNIEGKDEWGVAVERDKLFKALEPVNSFLEKQAFLSNETDCQMALMKSKAPISIFHYVGHIAIENGTGYLVASDLNSEEDQSFERLYANVLGPLLRRAGTTLAVFSACNSGCWAFIEPLLQAVPVVIGVRGYVDVNVAINFSHKLYSALAIGLSLDEAVTWARLYLLEPEVQDNYWSWQWGSFIVYMQTSEAVLFPRPRKPQMIEKQKVARQARQVTIIKVTNNINSNQGAVYGVSAGSIGAQVHTEKASSIDQET